MDVLRAWYLTPDLTSRRFSPPTNRPPTATACSEENAGLRILLYAGDLDTVCSVTGISLWLGAMQWRIREDWAPWFVPGGKQAVGKIRTYESGVVFMTLSGAGHEAPAFKPKEALFLFAQYLQGGFTQD